MAGKIIADIIEAPYDSIRMNVANVTVLTANNSGLTYLPTGNVNINIGSTASLTLGNVTVSNLITANGGIKFPATQVASGDANTLDDYEEGTWTATWTAEAAAPTTPQTDTGRYVKIGKLVTVAVRFNDKNLSGASGNMIVTGLPFTVTNNSINWPGSVSMYNTTLPANTKWVNPWAGSNQTYLIFYATLDNGIWAAVQIPASSGKYMELNITYETSA